MSVQMLNEHNNCAPIASTNRRSRSLSRSEISAQLASSPLSPPFPSFMSTIATATTVADGSTGYYNEGSEKSRLAPKILLDAGGSMASTSTESASATSTAPVKPSAIVHGLSHPRSTSSTALNPPQMPYQYLPRENLSIASGSTDSSPTTTISTFDSPVIQDTSPSSSPESPSSVTPLQSLKLMSRITHGDRPAAQLRTESRFKPNQSFSTYLRQPESPTRKARNLKNLSLKLPTISSHQTIATAPIREKTPNVSAPASPIQSNTRCLRRKPPNLTIKTPSFNRSFSNISEAVPPTPNTRPALRHIESSPSLNSILSPTTSTKPSLALPGSLFQSAKRPMPGAWEDRVAPDRPSPSAQHVFSGRDALHELVEEEDNLVSRESCNGSDKGYPDGPILIYDSGLYLYLEPSSEEASKFDVVINVAKEVANPFISAEQRQDTVVSVWKATLPDVQRQSVVEPDTALSEISFKSAFEFQPVGTESPTTPKRRAPTPEYIHVPWDHNSEILDDLYPLCEVIDKRISQGKRVLIHCQLGVSRSASLVIAYGLYKNPDKDFNAMYSIVKGRSCWVGPNMSLIYQLTDFRTRVQQRGPSRSPPAEWFDGSLDAKVSTTSKGQGNSSTSKTARPPVPLFDAAVGDSKYSSAPTLANPFNWTSPQTSSSNSTVSSSPATSQQRRNLPPRPLPLREKYQTIHSLRRPRHENSVVPSHRTLSRTAVHQMDLVMQDVPATPSVLSPRAAEFWTTPFSHLRTVAGDLACRLDKNIDTNTTDSGNGNRMSIESISSVVRACPPVPPGAADPRSPPQQRREPVIMRNIDEFL
ncbi:tyrosine-protein phosphatase MSG5 [Histoplasma ohiense]|nr:tyrosine-protein phosphatase MSG5 [Histoplasma ohiense (nom. inval.)]